MAIVSQYYVLVTNDRLGRTFPNNRHGRVEGLDHLERFTNPNDVNILLHVTEIGRNK